MGGIGRHNDFEHYRIELSAVLVGASGVKFSMSDDDKVIKFPGNTLLDLEPVDILEAAIEAELEEVIIIGFTKGSLVTDPLYIAGSQCDLGIINLMLDMAKNDLINNRHLNWKRSKPRN